VIAVAATNVQDNVSRSGSGEASHKRQSALEQPLRVAVLFRRAGCGTSIEEGPDVRGVVRGSGHDTAKR
jgi:hypothetical protein